MARTAKTKHQEECYEAYKFFESERDLEKDIENCVCDLKISLPEKPKDLSSIENYGKPIDQRVFPKHELSYIQHIDELKEYDEEKILYLDEMYNRWQNGYWFYNGNRLEYVTGNHYMMLQYWFLRVTDESGREFFDRPDFIDAQRDLFYVIREAKLNTDVGGVVFTTQRRWGKTICGAADGYFDTIINEAFNFAIQSKSEDDGKAILSKIVDSWKKLPRILRPVDSGYSTTSRAINFEEPQRKSTKGKHEYRYAIESHIFPVSSKNTALDGKAINYLYNDEVGKVEKQIADVYKRWQVNKFTLMNGTTITGFGFVTTTVEDVDGSSVMTYKKLVDKSNWHRRNEATNRTDTLLVRLFFPASYGMKGSATHNGEKVDFINKWGYSHMNAAKSYVVSTRIGREGSDLEEEIRKMPLTLDECFLAKEGGNNFNVKKLTDQKSHNAAHASKNPLVKGNFIYLENEKKVIFRPNENGKWLVRWMPNEKDRNRMEYDGYSYTPTRNFARTGVDPFDHRGSTNGESNGAAITIVHDPMVFSKPTVVCVYNHRPKTPTELWKDILYQCIFYSSFALVENNKYGMLEHWDDIGYAKFALTHPFDFDYFQRTVNRGMPTTDVMTREAMMNYAQEFIEDYIGLDYVTNKMNDCWFDDLLEDLRRFTPMKWTDFDMSVAFMLAVTAFKRHERTEEKKSRVDFSGLIKKHNLSKQRTLR